MARPKKIKFETEDGDITIIPVEITETPVAETIPDELKDEIPKPVAIRWKKVGGGSLYWNNKIIKPGQVFTATVDEIPKAFPDTIIPIDDLPAEPLLEISKSSNYSLRQKGDLWNIVDKRGKAINEKPMDLQTAETLLRVL